MDAYADDLHGYQGKVQTTRKVGEFIVDYSRTGRVVGLEILDLRDDLARHGGVIRIPPEVLPPLP